MITTAFNKLKVWVVISRLHRWPTWSTAWIHHVLIILSINHLLWKRPSQFSGYIWNILFCCNEDIQEIHIRSTSIPFGKLRTFMSKKRSINGLIVSSLHIFTHPWSRRGFWDRSVLQLNLFKTTCDPEASSPRNHHFLSGNTRTSPSVLCIMCYSSICPAEGIHDVL